VALNDEGDPHTCSADWENRGFDPGNGLSRTTLAMPVVMVMMMALMTLGKNIER